MPCRIRSRATLWENQSGDQKLIDSYKGRSAPELLPYPAKVAKDLHIWILVGDRFEIRLMGDSKAEDYKNTLKLRDFILAFDLDSMEDYSGPKLEKDQLKRFLPSLEGLN